MAQVDLAEEPPHLPKVRMARPRMEPDALSVDEQAFLRDFTAPRPSLEQRLAAGKALRDKTHRSSHADFKPSADRRDPVEIILKQNIDRIPELVPIRHARMLASPFSFMRGAAAVMAHDLAETPDSGVDVACCGDVHVNNFGVFASAERQLIFAINDFDEIYPGPWEWDLKRLAASAAVIAQVIGGEHSHAEDCARRCVASYRKRIRRYAEMGYLQTWYDTIDEHDILGAVPPKFAHDVMAFMDRARERGHMRALDRLTEEIGGQRRIVEQAPLIERVDFLTTGTPIQAALDRMLRTYIASLPDDRQRLIARYRIVDAARKTAGVGSVGLGCWVMLMEGLGEADPLFLQVKEAVPSVLEAYRPGKLPYQNQGRRVVVGQRMTQGSPDIFLGWGMVDGKAFYVRQLADMKGGVKLEDEDPETLGRLPDYCELCGWALALAHAKSGDPAIIAGYCGESDTLDEAIGRFALAYAQQNAMDFAALTAAAGCGRIQVAADARH